MQNHLNHYITCLFLINRNQKYHCTSLVNLNLATIYFFSFKALTNSFSGQVPDTYTILNNCRNTIVQNSKRCICDRPAHLTAMRIVEDGNTCRC